MKLYRNLFWCSLIISIISIIIIVVSSIYPTNFSNILTNVFCGVFASALLLLANSIIGYLDERKRKVFGLLQIITQIQNTFSEMEYMCREGVLLNLTKIKMDVIFERINRIVSIANNGWLNLQYDIVFLNKKSRKQKTMHEINRIGNDFFASVNSLKNDILNNKDNIEKENVFKQCFFQERDAIGKCEQLITKLNVLCGYC